MQKLILWSLLTVLLLTIAIVPTMVWAVSCGADGDPDIPQPRELPHGKLVPMDGESYGGELDRAPELDFQVGDGTTVGTAGHFERGSTQRTLLGFVLSLPWWLTL